MNYCELTTLIKSLDQREKKLFSIFNNQYQSENKVYLKLYQSLLELDNPNNENLMNKLGFSSTNLLNVQKHYLKKQILRSLFLHFVEKKDPETFIDFEIQFAIEKSLWKYAYRKNKELISYCNKIESFQKLIEALETEAFLIPKVFDATKSERLISKNQNLKKEVSRQVHLYNSHKIYFNSLKEAESKFKSHVFDGKGNRFSLNPVEIPKTDSRKIIYLWEMIKIKTALYMGEDFPDHITRVIQMRNDHDFLVKDAFLSRIYNQLISSLKDPKHCCEESFDEVFHSCELSSLFLKGQGCFQAGDFSKAKKHFYEIICFPKVDYRIDLQVMARIGLTLTLIEKNEFIGIDNQIRGLSRFMRNKNVLSGYFEVFLKFLSKWPKIEESGKGILQAEKLIPKLEAYRDENNIFARDYLDLTNWSNKKIAELKGNLK